MEPRSTKKHEGRMKEDGIGGCPHGVEAKGRKTAIDEKCCESSGKGEADRVTEADPTRERTQEKNVDEAPEEVQCEQGQCGITATSRGVFRSDFCGGRLRAEEKGFVSRSEAAKRRVRQLEPFYLRGRAKLALAEEKGFEPLVPCGTAVFKTAAFDHSATPPRDGDASAFCCAVAVAPFSSR